MTPDSPKGPESEALRDLEVASAAGREVERLTAELQAQNRLYRMVGSERDEKQCEVERLRRWVDRFRERAAEHAAEVSRLREQLDSATELVDHLLLLFATGEKGHPGRPCVRTGWIDETAVARFRERRAGLGVSSSEVEAPQPPMVQHKVRVTKLLGSGQSVAVCPGCRAGMTGADQEAEDWKDQHEADTLVPTGLTNDSVKLTDESSISQWNEVRPSGSERLAPRPELAYADRMTTECCASEGMTGIDCRLPKGHSDWHSGRFDPTGEGYESSYPVCIQWPRNESDRCEPEQDAAQAARSEATPRLRECVERWPACEEGTFNPSCCRFPKSCSCTIYDPAQVKPEDLESPSPSLRKEGEDSD